MRRPVLAALLLLALAGCSSTPAATSTSSSAGSTTASTSAPSSGPAGEPVALSGTLTIFAATSLKAAFDDLAAQFIATNSGVTLVPITYDGSTTLATQLTGGAEGDIFASADDNNMNTVTDAGLVVGTPTHFATNTLEIAVKPGNPLAIAGLADTVNPDVQLVLCDDTVPCGAAALKAYAAAGLTPMPVSKEQNVGAVLNAVQGTGEADAGVVYKTDIQNAAPGSVEGIDFPESAEAVTNYPMAVLKESANAEIAQAFAAFVVSPEGQAVLAGYGFTPPAG